ncbi:MmgE/PrpD family protein [Tianweitania sp. BSSL-BM11]|uniref:MmgE/PrpD family protein n=1 Tax=Tianweitania aestuarii TaxID=2814886 RepID=A0ABS5S1L5_9HYPH|nr:MmgE/PrpD family protein [Tianweitania aestuarii]MBS9721812.1 MmgE/PrpD family protein [Tianweitania aestuarii]
MNEAKSCSVEKHEEVAEALKALVQHTTQLIWSDLPVDVQQRAATVFCDDFTSLIAAREEPELQALSQQAARVSGPAEATVLNGARPALRLDRYSTALVNGTAADWAELDGGYRAVVCHAALYCIPALLAEAEATNASLQDLLLALVVGYETVARTAHAFSFPGLVLHPHGGLATVGSAAAVAKLRGSSADETFRAITTAATLCLPGPFNHAVSGALIRNVWPGLCAQNGIRAVDWEPLGITGSPWSMTEVFADIFGGIVDARAFDQALGEGWKITQGYHKMHACCQYAHSTVEAMLSALEQRKVEPESVEQIVVATHWKGRRLDRPQPETSLAAKFSIQHIAAATLAQGHAGATAFSADSLVDPDMVRLRDIVSIDAFPEDLPWPNDRPSHVKVVLSDGSHLEGTCLSAPGGADQPFSTQVLRDKILGNLAPAYPGGAELISAALDLDQAILAAPWRTTLAQMVG